jgi:hypothetical protein
MDFNETTLFFIFIFMVFFDKISPHFNNKRVVCCFPLALLSLVVPTLNKKMNVFQNAYKVLSKYTRNIRGGF